MRTFPYDFGIQKGLPWHKKQEESGRNKFKYDYLIVGAGLFGATFANIARKAGKKCLVIDKRDHIAGNCYTKRIEGIDVHRYGPHIFHTKDHTIWAFVNKFARFNNFRYRVKAADRSHLYSFPINLMTMHELWGVTSPSAAMAVIENEKVKGIEEDSVEGWCLSNLGKDLYELFIKGYTEKQWGMPATALPSFIVRRLPVRFTFCDDYFDEAEYQGIPINGYTAMVGHMLHGTEVWLNTDFFSMKEVVAKKIIFTGKLDEFYGYKYGRLGYRSLTFEETILEQDDYLGISVMNYPSKGIPFTRLIEHKHFDITRAPKGVTVLTKEIPGGGDELFYPIPVAENLALLRKYEDRAQSDREAVRFGGRLGSYQYLNMDQTIALAFALGREEGVWV